MDTADGAFVILRHSGYGDLHWDLMLQAGDHLETWRCPSPPGLGHHPDGGCRGPASSPAGIGNLVRLPAHRLAYLDYEGDVSGGRGVVTREDRGTFRTLSRQEHRWDVELAGEVVRGRFGLRRDPPPSQNWSFWRL